MQRLSQPQAAETESFACSAYQAVGSAASVPAEASVDDLWKDTAFWHLAASMSTTDDWPVNELQGDESRSLVDAIDELSAALGRLELVGL